MSKDNQLVLLKHTKDSSKLLCEAESINDLVRRLRELDGRKIFSSSDGGVKLEIAKQKTTYETVAGSSYDNMDEEGERNE